MIRDALAPHKDDLLDKLWAVVETPDKGKESQRLRAAAALAKYDPESEKWAKVQRRSWSTIWCTRTRVYLGQWMEAFRPVQESTCCRRCRRSFEISQPSARRSGRLATNILADYAADQPQVLADLLMDADEKQFAVIYPKFKEQGEQGLPVLTGEIDKKLPPDCHRTTPRRSWRSGRRMRRWLCSG